MKPQNPKSLSASTNSTNHKMCKFKQTEIGLIQEALEVRAIGEIAETLGGGGMRHNRYGIKQYHIKVNI